MKSGTTLSRRLTRNSAENRANWITVLAWMKFVSGVALLWFSWLRSTRGQRQWKLSVPLSSSLYLALSPTALSATVPSPSPADNPRVCSVGDVTWRIASSRRSMKQLGKPRRRGWRSFTPRHRYAACTHSNWTMWQRPWRKISWIR